MKIIMMRPSYRPELSGGTHLAIDLVEDIIKAGHQIEVVTPISDKFLSLVDEKSDECVIHRIKSRFNKKDSLSRILRYIDISVKMYKITMRLKGDIIMTHSMPPLLGPIGVLLKFLKKLPVVYWEQDIVSESLLTTGILGRNLKSRVSYIISDKLEQISERGSSHIITISNYFKSRHLKRGISADKVSVVYNWIDTEQIYPVEKENNSLYDALGISRDKFVVTYCGNLGVPQNVEIMIDAAERLQQYEDIVFVIIGGGSREEYIKKYISEKNLTNLVFSPLFPLEMSHLVYSLGDVSLVIGRNGTSRNGFPSKTWSIMAAGKAMISCFDKDSELSQFVELGKCGISIEPDNSNRLAESILVLYSDKEMCKQMGYNARCYVCENFNRNKATDKFLKILQNQVR